jgi:hypothetical protein
MINEKNIELKDKFGNKAKFANQFGWTDVNPVEIVKVISDKTLEVRGMDAEIDPSFKLDEVAGGFFSHVKNNRDQKWIIKSDPKSQVYRIRKSKHGVWKCRGGSRHILSDEPIKFYDYNF